MDTALGDAGMASLRLEDDAVDSTEEAATLDSLPLEMLLSILAHVTPAETLRHAPAVCKSWQSAVIGASESLWMPHLAKDYPLFCECPLDRPARDAYDQARSGEELPVQLLNPGLTAGTFGATSVCTARYSAVDRADWLNAGCLIVKERGPGLISVHGKRLRRVEGVQEHAPMEPSFAALRPGEMVELQWKKGWFALVHRVVSDDEIQLFFPQYGSTLQEHGGSSLVGVSTLHRTRETSMHGGIAGGIRQLSPVRVAQWWRVLGSTVHDTEVHDPRGLGSARPQNGGLAGIRQNFLRHLPKEQPALSLELAGATEAETSAVVMAVVRHLWDGMFG